MREKERISKQLEGGGKVSGAGEALLSTFPSGRHWQRRRGLPYIAATCHSFGVSPQCNFHLENCQKQPNKHNKNKCNLSYIVPKKVNKQTFKRQTNIFAQGSFP